MESTLITALMYHDETFIQDKSSENSDINFAIFDDYIAFLKI